MAGHRVAGADERKRGDHSHLQREDGNPNDGGAYDRKRNAFGRRSRCSVAGGGPQRSGELDELRDDGFPTGLWLSARESRETHVGSSSEGTIHFVERHAGAGRAICATAAWLPPAGHPREGVLIWKFAGATTTSRSPSLTPFLPNSSGKFQQVRTRTAFQPPNNASSVHQPMENK